MNHHEGRVVLGYLLAIQHLFLPPALSEKKLVSSVPILLHIGREAAKFPSSCHEARGHLSQICLVIPSVLNALCCVELIRHKLTDHYHWLLVIVGDLLAFQAS